MNRKRSLKRFARIPAWVTALVLTALATGCGGGDAGREPILGGPVTISVAPTVLAVTPLAGATGVALNAKIITVSFSAPMNPSTFNATSFTLACPAGSPVTGAVSYSAAGNLATFTAAGNLPASTTCTASISTGVTDVAGRALANAVSWNFTTSAALDISAPSVSLTAPLAGATAVANNTLVTAGFSEAMDPATINAASFTLACPSGTPVSGTVAYALNSNVATFTPTASLPVNTVCTISISTAAKDTAGNALASPAVWSFTTGAVLDVGAPSITLVNPADLASGVCINKAISATFSEAMDPITINAASFVLTGVSGAVSYSALNKTATFTPTSNLAANTLFAAKVTTSVKDLAGNAMTSNKAWSFTTGATSCALPVALGAAAPFGGFGGGAGMTNQGILTIVNGDIATTAVSTAVTGFHDSVNDIYTETPLNVGSVTGRIYTAAPTAGGAGVGGTAATFVVASAAANAALNAYNSLTPASLPGGIDPGAGQLGGLTLAPGIYMAASGTFLLTGSDLTLDGKGDANAVWVFQTASGLTVGAPAAPRNITLINGAQAKNVFWQVGSSARIEDRSHMVGTIIASKGVTISTSGQLATTTLDGRALGLNASVTLVNTVINVPAP